MKSVIDTNVAIVANGRNTHASLKCQLNCIEFLQQLINPKSKYLVVLDEASEILSEYSTYLHYHGEPGVGDQFFKFLHDNLHLEQKIEVVRINRIDDPSRSFEELPPNTLDVSDRKFAATALVSKAEICNAVDSDWHLANGFLNEVGLTVNQICPDHCCPQQALF